MKETRFLWDMPITIEITDRSASANTFQYIFSYFEHIDSLFNIFSESSEISRINRNEIPEKKWSSEVREVLALCKTTRKQTGGYFEYDKHGFIDPLGLVKGWAITKGSIMLRELGFENFYIEAGGDIQVQGNNTKGTAWTVGIRNPFNRFENVKTLVLKDRGIATSGSYIRGNHIYNPHKRELLISGVVSLTVIGNTAYEADRFATAAFAMGKEGIYFIEKTSGLEGYMIDPKGIATYTSGFEKYAEQKKISNLSTQIHL